MFLLPVKSKNDILTIGDAIQMGAGLEPCFSRDGKWIAFEGGYGMPDGILAMAVTGKHERLLIPDGEQPTW